MLDILVIAPASEAAWWRDSIAQLDRPEALVTLHYTPRRFGVAETARLIEATVRAKLPIGQSKEAA